MADGAAAPTQVDIRRTLTRAIELLHHHDIVRRPAAERPDGALLPVAVARPAVAGRLPRLQITVF